MPRAQRRQRSKLERPAGVDEGDRVGDRTPAGGQSGGHVADRAVRDGQEDDSQTRLGIQRTHERLELGSRAHKPHSMTCRP